MLPASKSPNSKDLKQSFFFAFHGDPEILQFLTLRVELSITIDKPIVSIIPIVPLITDQDWKNNQIAIDPLIRVQVFGQAEKDFILSNKAVFKDNTMYIYFPSNVRVDEKVNKMYINSYESIIRELPRSVKNNFCKLIIFEKGTGELSLEYQKAKCSQMLAALFKQHLEKRLEQYISGINSVLQSEINVKALHTILRNRYGLAHIFRKIGVNQKAQQYLQLLWQDMLYNQRHFISNNSDYQLLPPFVETNYAKILSEFYSPTNYLKICSFCFLRSYELDLQLMSYCQAMRALKKFIDASLNNILFSNKEQENVLLKNMWIIGIIEECYDIGNRLGRVYPTFLNAQKEAEYHHLAVHIARTYRSAMDNLGHLLYQFNPQTNYPRSIQIEIECCLQKLKRTEEPQKLQPSQVNQARLLQNRVGENFVLIFGGLECFKIIYLKALVNFYEIMSRSSHYLRMARALKLLVLKAYLSITKPSKLIIPQTYLKSYTHSETDIQAYIDGILKKAEKIVVFEDEDHIMSHALSKKMVRYSIEKDDFVNRNRQDEVLWSNLKFMEDYYRFIILLEAYRNQPVSDRKCSDSSLSLSFSVISSKIPIKTDNIIHLLLNSSLMGLERQWQFTLQLVRQIFLLQKGEEVSINQNIPTPVRLGILLQASLRHQPNVSKLSLKLNNQQLFNLAKINSHSSISTSLLIVDIHDQQKTVGLKLTAQKILPQGMFELEFQIQEEGCLIFIIKELQIRIGLLVCYYVNKSIEIQEIKQLEEGTVRAKKKSRKYSSFQEKLKEEEFVHMINKSQQLAMSYLHFRTFTLTSKHMAEESRKSMDVSPLNTRRRSSGQMNRSSGQMNRSSRSNSQMSILNMMKDKAISLSIYKNLWTPVSIILKPNYISQCYNLDLLLDKISISTGQTQQVSQHMCINGVWINRLTTKIYHIQFTQPCGAEIIFMLKFVGSNLNKTNSKFRKHSEMSQSIFSNTSYEKGDSANFKLEVIQQNYKYIVETIVSYLRNSPLEVKYLYCQDLQEYTVSNLTNLPLKIKNQQEEFLLYPKEEVKLDHHHLQIAVHTSINQHSSGIQELSKEKIQFFTKVNLQTYIKKELLRPEKIETFELSLVPQEIYRKMELIKVRSSSAGNLSILDPGKGFEILGKVEGELNLDQHGCIDLFLLPIETGKLILPRILIDSKKGVWKDSIFINVEQ